MRAFVPRRARVALLPAALLLLPALLVAQPTTRSTRGAASSPTDSAAAPVAPHSRVLGLADYGRWSRITGTTISSDGAWLSYAYQPNDGDATLHLRRLADTAHYDVPVGSGAEFSDDGRWVAFFTQPPEKEAEKLRKARKPVPRTAVLLELATGRRDSISNAANVTFADGGRWVAVRHARTDTASKATGADVVLRDLRSGATRHIGAVGQLAFNDQATLLAYSVDAADQAGNGIYLIELVSGRTTPLLTGSERFDGLAWSDDGARLAVLHGDAPEKSRHRANALAVFSTLTAAAPSRADLLAAAVPTGMVVSENAPPKFSHDGSRVFIGLREQEAAPPKSDEPAANVDVWHWKDEEVQSVQIVRAAQERRFTWAAAFLVADRKLVPLADTAMRTVTPTALGTVALGRDGTPYRADVAWGGGRADWYAVSTSTGARTPIVRGITRTMGSSPDGRWFLYLKEGHVFAHDMVAGKATDLTQQSGVDFLDMEDDHPYERPIYGVAGWSKDGRSVLLHHRFDVWQLPLAGGKGVNLTHGIGDSAQIRFRVVRLDRPAGGARGRGGVGSGDDDDQGIDMSKPLVLAAYGEWTKQSGYWQREPDGRLHPLLFGDEMIGALARAEHGDRVVFTRQTFEQFPDVWTAPTAAAMASAQRVTDANPQLVEYRWGRRLLVDYTNSKGQRLQGTLALPAGYEPGKQYPMIVYYYETVSNRHHEFSMPVYDDRPHFSEYASDGYLVFMPDIVYEEGKPGSSALDCVTSGVKKVIELGYADPARIGLQGHSWGGYESSFIITQTDMFRTAVIGAPPADLSSMYGQLYKNSGTANSGIFEIGQVRMGDGKNPWSAHELYESQSPVHQVQGIHTPFLILQGTDDGAVDWLQGVELYNAARRFGKEVVFLSYPGENHHLAKKENTKDFQLRMKQWFDHYLKDAPAPKWMTEGVPFLRKGESPTVMP